MTTQQPVVVCSSHLDLCPPPLHIRKKARKATFYKRILRKASQHPFYDCTGVNGPLDDIISEISGDIWRSPSETIFDLQALLGSQNPLKAPPTCIVTPLPVSRIPSRQPLTVRKNRNKSSTASDSSTSKTMTLSGAFGRAKSASTSGSSGIENGKTYKPRGSRMEFITNFSKKLSSRLRRDETGESDENNTPSISSPMATHLGPGENDKLAYPESKLMSRVADRLPSPTDVRYEEIDSAQNKQHHAESISIVEAAINITSQEKVLTEEEVQDFWVSVEITGMLHNRQELSDSAIDVAFIIDNGYYVSKQCLQRALDAVMGALQLLDQGDKVALYTSHCTHGPITGTTPEMIYPLRSFDEDTEGKFQKLTAELEKGGCQSRFPPLPNPSMSNVVLAVAKSLTTSSNKAGRTHLIVLSPTKKVLHKVSEDFPHLYIHQINPAVLIYRHNEQGENEACLEPCCENVFVHGWSCYQSVPSSIKHIIRNARSETPVGAVLGLEAEIREKKGCEILSIQGSTEISRLRLGQTYSLFVHVRVTRSQIKELNTASFDPILESSLKSSHMGRDLRNVKGHGATLVHVLSVQLIYRNSLHTPETFCYTESQLLLLKDDGNRLAPSPILVDFHKRHLFHLFSKLDTQAAQQAVENMSLSAGAQEHLKHLKMLIEAMNLEISHQKRILEYEMGSRTVLSYCPGPVAVSIHHHDWLVQLWNAKKKNKSQGISGH